MTENFRVEWTPEADEHLPAVWLAANDRSAVTAAVDHADALLRLDPASSGTGLHEGLRAIDMGPIQIVCEVAKDDRLVTVVAVSQSRAG